MIGILIIEQDRNRTKYKAEDLNRISQVCDEIKDKSLQDLFNNNELRIRALNTRVELNHWLTLLANGAQYEPSVGPQLQKLYSQLNPFILGVSAYGCYTTGYDAFHDMVMHEEPYSDIGRMFVDYTGMLPLIAHVEESYEEILANLQPNDASTLIDARTRFLNEHEILRATIESISNTRQ